MKDWKTPFKRMEIGKGKMIRDGNDIAVISIGHVGNDVEKACTELAKRNISVAHYNIRFLKPMDSDLLHVVFKKFNKVISIEDGAIIGGLGSALLEFKSDHGYTSEVRRLGIPDRFIEQGTISELHHECGYDVEGMVTTILEMVS
jgi:1-deoxy-D-xylulose-5-phosphate synthase